jgi:hypothetical protein
MVYTPLGFKWLDVLRYRLQAFCSGDKFASTTSPASHSPNRNASGPFIIIKYIIERIK